MAKRKNQGRPTKYEIRYNNQAYRHCLLGATNDDLALLFEINVDTINQWMKVHPKFSDSVKRGRIYADQKVSLSLFQKATGYKKSVTKVFQFQGSAVQAEYREYFPPDTTAAIFWLKNRRPTTWRDRHNLDLGGGVNHQHTVTDEQLKRILFG